MGLLATDGDKQQACRKRGVQACLYIIEIENKLGIFQSKIWFLCIYAIPVIVNYIVSIHIFSSLSAAKQETIT